MTTGNLPPTEHLGKIQKLYDDGDSWEKNLYSKIALLEACGFIEEEMDRIVISCAARILSDKKNEERIAKSVKETYGFGYDAHFRKLLERLVGLSGVEKLESDIGGAIGELKTCLGNLREPRDKAAHTPAGAQAFVYAPSWVIDQFTRVWNGLINVERVAERLWPGKTPIHE